VSEFPEEPASGLYDSVAIVVDATEQVPLARRRIARRGAVAGLLPSALDRLSVAVSEVLTNAMTHGGGHARVTTAAYAARFVVTVIDQGPGGAVAPRALPAAGQAGGRGLWLASHLCDGITIDSSPAGTTVRLFMALPGGSGDRRSQPGRTPRSTRPAPAG
jgi:anti-sigma regulatory factor (Ser/Thr protein kinase)